MPTWSILVNRLLIRRSSQLQAFEGRSGALVHSGARAVPTRVGRLHVPAPEVFAMPGSVIVNGARTPIGRLLGSLKDFSGADLGGIAIKAALERPGVSP